MPMQYTTIVIFAIFLIFAQNIDCGYTLEPPHLEPPRCPQFLFSIKNNKIRYTPANPSFAM